MSLIRIENLSHSFGDKVVLSGADFRMEKGEHIGLVGANGSGKTTFLNILTEEIIPDKGIVNITKSLKTGYMTQKNNIEDYKTIIDLLKDAFSYLYNIENKYIVLTQKISTATESDQSKMLDKLSIYQDILETNNFYSIPESIENVSKGLGLYALGLNTKFSELSGGQRTKVLLAKLLLEKPDILLLDEPTNYLDKEHVEWLTEYLKNYKNSFLVISHDTHFLNQVVNVIYTIEFTKMKRYPGNYEKYLNLKDEYANEYYKLYQKQQKDIDKMEDFINKNIARASTVGRAKSRIKQLDKIERLEKPKLLKKPNFIFNSARESSNFVLKAENMSIGYNKPLFTGLDFKIKKGQKIAVTGCNGIGKTTLLKTILGIIPSIKGSIKYGEYLYPAYYEQESNKYMNLTPIEVVASKYEDLTQKEIRNALASCGLGKQHVVQMMHCLSGGEQSKVRLCILMLKRSNWLILDEPTNHLDVDSKDSLKESLIKYKGTIILVSHEEQFYKDWVTDIWNMEEYH